MTDLMLGQRGQLGRSQVVVGKLALIIDHEPLIRNLIANLLAIKEIDSDQGATRDEALRLLSEYRYHLIFVDLMLPRENGFAMLDEIRTKWPDRIPHTILTTSGEPEFLARLPQDGWCSVLIKPFGMSEFFRIVGVCLDGQSAAGLCYN